MRFSLRFSLSLSSCRCSFVPSFPSISLPIFAWSARIFRRVGVRTLKRLSSFCNAKNPAETADDQKSELSRVVTSCDIRKESWSVLSQNRCQNVPANLSMFLSSSRLLQSHWSCSQEQGWTGRIWTLRAFLSTAFALRRAPCAERCLFNGKVGHESASFVLCCYVMLCFVGMTWYDQCDPIRSHSIPEWPQSGLFPQCPTGIVVIFTAVRIGSKSKVCVFPRAPSEPAASLCLRPEGFTQIRVVQRAGWIHVQFAGHAWSCMAMHLFDHELLSVFLLNNMNHVLSDVQTLGLRNQIIPSHRSMGIQITLPLLFLAKIPRKNYGYLRIQQPLWAQNGIQRHHPITIPSSIGSDHSPIIAIVQPIILQSFQDWI